MKTCTIIKNYSTKKELIKNGNCNEKYTPCSTFKLAIALMGYDKKVLINENKPVIKYNPKIHINAFNKNQKQNQTPKSWLKYSCIWYSEELIKKIDEENLRKCLKMFNYGNQDFTAKKVFWIRSSLKISTEEQINFIGNLLSHKFPISEKSYKMLEKIMPVIEVKDWKIYGKIGTAIYNEKEQSGWFVGWAENTKKKIIFAKHIDRLKIKFDGKNFASTIARDDILNYFKEL